MKALLPLIATCLFFVSAQASQIDNQCSTKELTSSDYIEFIVEELKDYENSPLWEALESSPKLLYAFDRLSFSGPYTGIFSRPGSNLVTIEHQAYKKEDGTLYIEVPVHNMCGEPAFVLQDGQLLFKFYIKN